MCSSQAAVEASLAAARATDFREEVREALGFVCAADRSRRAHAVRGANLSLVKAAMYLSPMVSSLLYYTS